MGFMQELFEINVLNNYLVNSENYEIILWWCGLMKYCIVYGIDSVIGYVNIYEFVMFRSWEITVIYEYGVMWFVT